MKKIFIVLAISAIWSISVFAQDVAPKRENLNGKTVEVIITIDGKKFDAEIEENLDTTQILGKLPMELSMHNLNGSNLIWGGNFAPAKGTFVKELKKGELALCSADYFIVFYDDYPSNAGSQFRPIGRLTSGLENLKDISNGGKLRIEKK